MVGTPGPGRDRIVATPEEFEAKADAYFAECEASGRRPTVNGLTLALGYAHRQSLFDCADREGFSDAVKRARTRLESAWEEALAAPQVAGAIFWLKNQGWSDKTEHELSGPGKGPIESVTRFRLADLE